MVLERMDFPDPVIKVAIEPKTKADVDKMANGLIKLAQEDPSFHFSRDDETNQTVIEGMGELHLEIIVDRLKREYKVEANVGAPQVRRGRRWGGQVRGQEYTLDPWKAFQLQTNGMDWARRSSPHASHRVCSFMSECP